MSEGGPPGGATNPFGVLEPLGVPQHEEQVYRILVARSNLTLQEIAVAAAMTPATAKKVLRQLEDKGMISRVPAARPRFVATAPDLVLDSLIARRQDQLLRAKLETARLLEQFHAASHHRTPASPVDLATGPEASRQRQIQVQNSAREQVRIFDRPPYVFPPDVPNPEELALLRDGIRYRVIYDESSLDVPGKFESVKRCVEAGEEARVFRGVSIKLMVADDHLGLIHDPARDFQSSIVVHPSPLLHALIDYFDLLWNEAVPLTGKKSAGERGSDLDEIDSQILVMLSAGTGDEAIARRLNLGVRTVRRRLARMMELLGAKTRFEAGARAARRGWI